MSGQINLGRVKGNVWYTGPYISGVATTPTVYPNSGVSRAFVGDFYMHTGSPQDQYTGCVYRCVTAGDPDNAQWVYMVTLRGPAISMANTLDSTSTAQALTAAQGKVLADMIKSVGTFLYTVHPATTERAYSINIQLDNTTTDLEVEEVTGNVAHIRVEQQEGVGAKHYASISVNTSNGFSGTGAIITRITSSTAAIYEYTLYNDSAQQIVKRECSISEILADLESHLVPVGEIVEVHEDGVRADTTVRIMMDVNDERQQVFPETHADAVWADSTRTETVKDLLEQLQDFKKNFWKEIFPVGAIFTDATGTVNPNEKYGGVWERIENRFLYASESTPGIYGGSLTHNHGTFNTGNTTLTEDTMPKHTHVFTGQSATTANAGSHVHETPESAKPGGLFASSAKLYWSKNSAALGTADGLSANPGQEMYTTAPKSTTLAAGTHNHTVTAKGTIATTGQGKGHSHSIPETPYAEVLPPYMSVVMWVRRE